MIRSLVMTTPVSVARILISKQVFSFVGQEWRRITQAQMSVLSAVGSEIVSPSFSSCENYQEKRQKSYKDSK